MRMNSLWAGQNSSYLHRMDKAVVVGPMQGNGWTNAVEVAGCSGFCSGSCAKAALMAGGVTAVAGCGMINGIIDGMIDGIFWWNDRWQAAE
jgi:hypothetical protein